VIRLSTWAEIRHMHLIDGVSKKEVARRLDVNVKTVRRALQQEQAPGGRASPPARHQLEEHRDDVLALIAADPRIGAKRIGRVLELKGVPRLNERSLRRCVAKIRGCKRTREVFIHRTAHVGQTTEVDFGESWAEIGGRRGKVHFVVSTLSASNVYFAKAYHFERLECLMDGMAEAFAWFGGLTERAVLDNTGLVVKKVLKGADRIETKRFAAFRGEWPLKVEYCAPASGWEKGSVERGVEYVRGLAFRPIPKFETMEDLNASIVTELDADLDRRKLPDGRTARMALIAEREHLRPLPRRIPDASRLVPCVADKYTHVQVDRSTYSVPSEFARRALTVRIYHDHIEAVADGRVVARHRRSTCNSTTTIDIEHVIDILERKPRAALEATVIRNLGLPAPFYELRDSLRENRRHSDKEWVQVIRLLIDHPLAELVDAITAALRNGAPGLATILHLLRSSSPTTPCLEPVSLNRADLAQMRVAEPDLAAWDAIHEGGRA
jgi:transposase